MPVEKNIYLQVLEFEIKEKGVDFFFSIMGLLECILEYTRKFFFFLNFFPHKLVS